MNKVARKTSVYLLNLNCSRFLMININVPRIQEYVCLCVFVCVSVCVCMCVFSCATFKKITHYLYLSHYQEYMLK